MASAENQLPKRQSTFGFGTNFDSDSSGSCWRKHRELGALALSVLTHLPRKSCWNQFPGLLQISVIGSAKNAICSTHIAVVCWFPDLHRYWWDAAV